MLLGMGAPITGVTPIFAISFLGFGIGKRLQQSHPNEQLTLVQFFNAGAFSAFGTTIHDVRMASNCSSPQRRRKGETQSTQNNVGWWIGWHSQLDYRDSA